MANTGDPVSTISYTDIGFPGGGATVEFDPHSTYLLAARTGRFSVCDTQTGDLEWHLEGPPSVVVAGGACTPDGASVALLWGPLTDLHIRVLELATEQETFVTGPGILGNPVFSPDGQLLAYQDATTAGTLAANTIVVAATVGAAVKWTTPGAVWSAGTFGGQTPIVFSPDSRFLGYRKGNELVLLDAGSGRPTPTTTPAPGPWTFTADARCVVTLGWQPGRWPTVTFTDVDTGLTVDTIELVFPSLPPAVLTATFTRDARRVAVMGASSFAVFDLPTPVPEPPQTHPLFAPQSVDASAVPPKIAFSPGGHLLSVSHPLPDGSIELRIVDAATGETKWQRDGTGEMRSAFSPDGRYFAVWGNGSYDDDGQQSTWTEVQVLTAGDPYQPTDAGFTGKLSSQAHFDPSLAQVGVTGGATPLAAAVTAADPAPDADPTIVMLRPSDAAPTRTVVIPGAVTALACGPDAPWVAVGSAAGVLRVFHSDPADLDWQAHHDGLVNAVAAAATGRLLATASSDLRARVFAVKPAQGQNLTDCAPLWSTVKHPQSVIRVAISADEQWIVTGCADGVVRFFENDGAPGDHPARSRNIASSSRLRALTLGGTHLGAAGYADGSAVVFNAATADPVTTFWHPAPVLSVCFNSTATLLVTATTAPDAQLRVWDITAEGTDPILTIDYRRPISDIAASPTAPIVATGLASGAVAILNIENGSDWIRLPFEEPVRSVEFNADGTTMVAASEHLLHIYSTA